MSHPANVEIDHVHCRAICDEIGERLRFYLLRDLPEPTTRLQELLNRLSELDLDIADAPSITPSITSFRAHLPNTAIKRQKFKPAENNALTLCEQDNAANP
jgi:hypothetical protein